MSTTFTDILVATDFSPCSTRAANMACELAQQLGARLTLLHVWTVPEYPYAASHGGGMLISSSSLDHNKNVAAACDALNSEADRLRTTTMTTTVLRKLSPHQETVPLHVDTLFIAGLPWATIIDAVAEHKFDLVVLGTHGRKGIVDRFLMGSVAEKVVRASPVPVLTVGPATPH